jgi:hypothetical protein
MLTRRAAIAGAAAIAAAAVGRLHATAEAATAWDWWGDLLNFRPDAANLNALRLGRGRSAVEYNVQRIELATGDWVNFDFYAVEIAQLPSSGPTTLSDLFVHIRRNLADLLDKEYSTFRGWSEPDRQDWDGYAAAPLGSVMVFDIPGLGPVKEQAGVVTSAATDWDWVFSPVTIGTCCPGEHPVSGNRQFGLTQSAEGRVRIYTRAVDRVLASAVPGENIVFAGADNLWRSFQRNLSYTVNSTGGRAGIVPPIVYRPTWADVVASGLFRWP